MKKDIYFKILDALYEKVSNGKADEFDDTTFEITFKDSGNKWTVVYHLHWGGTRYGYRTHCKAINGNTVKHFRDLDKLARAIAAGYIK